jgi:hypothetical protein
VETLSYQTAVTATFEPRDHARAQHRAWHYGGGGDVSQPTATAHSTPYCPCDRDGRGRRSPNPRARRAFQAAAADRLAEALRDVDEEEAVEEFRRLRRRPKKVAQASH